MLREASLEKGRVSVGRDQGEVRIKKQTWEVSTVQGQSWRRDLAQLMGGFILARVGGAAVSG